MDATPLFYLKDFNMFRLILLLACVCSGCVSTTKIIIRHEFPEENLKYEISREWQKRF